jgi:hypothetical protein
MPVARAVEAVRAELALGQADGVHHAFHFSVFNKTLFCILAYFIKEILSF